MTYSPWIFVENQNDLNKLRDDFNWDEARLAEFYGCLTSEPYFPQDISRSGRRNQNVHMLVELSCHATSDPDFVQLVLIDCDLLDLTYMHSPRFNGRVDSLKRVFITAYGATETRCARLIYRTIHDRERALVNPFEEPYFIHSDSINKDPLLQ